MTLPTSGRLSISDIAGEFGGDAPHALSEYYGASNEIPTSGLLKISDFYGTSAAYYADETFTVADDVIREISGDGKTIVVQDMNKGKYNSLYTLKYNPTTGRYENPQFLPRVPTSEMASAIHYGDKPLFINRTGTRLVMPISKYVHAGGGPQEYAAFAYFKWVDGGWSFEQVVSLKSQGYRNHYADISVNDDFTLMALSAVADKSSDAYYGDTGGLLIYRRSGDRWHLKARIDTPLNGVTPAYEPAVKSWCPSNMGAKAMGSKTIEAFCYIKLLGDVPAVPGRSATTTNNNVDSTYLLSSPDKIGDWEIIYAGSYSDLRGDQGHHIPYNPLYRVGWDGDRYAAPSCVGTKSLMIGQGPIYYGSGDESITIAGQDWPILNTDGGTAHGVTLPGSWGGGFYINALPGVTMLDSSGLVGLTPTNFQRSGIGSIYISKRTALDEQLWPYAEIFVDGFSIRDIDGIYGPVSPFVINNGKFFFATYSKVIVGDLPTAYEAPADMVWPVNLVKDTSATYSSVRVSSSSISADGSITGISIYRGDDYNHSDAVSIMGYGEGGFGELAYFPTFTRGGEGGNYYYIEGRRGGDGFALSADGKSFAVAEPYRDNNGVNSPAIVHYRVVNDWSETPIITVFTSTAADKLFGRHITISGDGSEIIATSSALPTSDLVRLSPSSPNSRTPIVVPNHTPFSGYDPAHHAMSDDGNVCIAPVAINGAGGMVRLERSGNEYVQVGDVYQNPGFDAVSGLISGDNSVTVVSFKASEYGPDLATYGSLLTHDAAQGSPSIMTTAAFSTNINAKSNSWVRLVSISHDGRFVGLFRDATYINVNGTELSLSSSHINIMEGDAVRWVNRIAPVGESLSDSGMVGISRNPVYTRKSTG